MVGRERELTRLRETFDAAVADRRVAVHDPRHPGVGKSRLVEEFLGSLGEATVLRGRCPVREGITFFPVGEVVKEAAGPRTSTRRTRSSGRSARCSGRTAGVLDARSASARPTTAARSRRRSGRCGRSWRRWRRRHRSPSCSTTSTGASHVPGPDRAHHRPREARSWCSAARPELLDERAGGWGRDATTISLEPLLRR